MKTKTSILAILFCFSFPVFLFGQSFNTSWFDAHEYETYYTSSKFIKNSNGPVFRVYRTYRGYMNPPFYRITRLDNELLEIQDCEVNKKLKKHPLHLVSLRFGVDEITEIAFYYNKRTQELVFCKASISPITLAYISDYEIIKTFPNISYRSPRDSRFPVSSVISPDNNFIAIQILGREDQETKATTVFVLDNQFQTIFQQDVPEGIELKHVTNDKKLHFLKEDSETIYSSVLDMETSERVEVELETCSRVRHWTGEQEISYFYSFQQSDSEKDEIEFDLFSPEFMSSPIRTIIPDSSVDFFSKNFHHSRCNGMMLSQHILEIHRNENGNQIISTEFIAHSIGKINNMQYTEYQHGNIVTFCINQIGEVTWIVCIPKWHYEKVNGMVSAGTVSALTFRTQTGLHFLYNDGVNNLTQSYKDKARTITHKKSGTTIIAHASISNEGELKREVFYDLSNDEMLFYPRDSWKVSDELIILKLKKRRAEKLGIIQLE